MTPSGVDGPAERRCRYALCSCAMGATPPCADGPVAALLVRVETAEAALATARKNNEAIADLGAVADRYQRERDEARAQLTAIRASQQRTEWAIRRDVDGHVVPMPSEVTARETVEDEALRGLPCTVVTRTVLLTDWNSPAPYDGPVYVGAEKDEPELVDSEETP